MAVPGEFEDGVAFGDQRRELVLGWTGGYPAFGELIHGAFVEHEQPAGVLGGEFRQSPWLSADEAADQAWGNIPGEREDRPGESGEGKQRRQVGPEWGCGHP